jgi:hypothetical protein
MDNERGLLGALGVSAVKYPVLARPDSTRPGKVPTPVRQVPTFSRHLGRFFVAVGSRNRDIRLETRVLEGLIARDS